MDGALSEPNGDAADFLDRPPDQSAVVGDRFLLFGGGMAFARCRISAIMAKASMTRETWPMPAVPGAGLVVIELQLVLGGLEAVLDGPAMAFDLDQRGDVGPGRAPGREEGQLAVSQAAADQKTSRPQTGCSSASSDPWRSASSQ